MKRNMMQIIEQTKVDAKYSINSEEMQLLKAQFDNNKDLFGLMKNLFLFGYAMGIRAEKAKNNR